MTEQDPEEARSRRGAGLVRGVLILGSVVVLVGVGAVIYGRWITAREAAALEPPGRLVIVDGLPIHVRCLEPTGDRAAAAEAEGTNDGAPTVWIDAGNASFSLDWAGLQPRLAELAPTCVWDRPGYGWSEPSSSPRRSGTVVRKLRSVVERLDRGPLVLVGHSLGALHALLYAERDPENLVGLVLVDPAPPRLVRSSMFQEFQRQSLGYYRTMQLLSHSGLLPLMGSVGGESALPETARRLPEVRDPYLTLTVQPSFWETAIAELDVIEESAGEVAAAVGIPLGGRRERGPDRRFPLGDVPLVVLSAGRPDGIPPELLDEQRAGHRRLASLSSRGEIRPLPGSGHSVHFDAPGAIVEAVEDVLTAAAARDTAELTDTPNVPTPSAVPTARAAVDG